MRTLPVLHILWEDVSCGRGGWQANDGFDEHLKQRFLVNSFGSVVYEDAKVLMLSMSTVPDEDGGVSLTAETLRIPKVYIVRRTKLGTLDLVTNRVK
jgi:hypothetical protein